MIESKNKIPQLPELKTAKKEAIGIMQQVYDKKGIFADNCGNKFDFAKKTINDVPFTHSMQGFGKDSLSISAKQPLKIKLSGDDEAVVNVDKESFDTAIATLYFDGNGRLLRIDSRDMQQIYKPELPTCVMEDLKQYKEKPYRIDVVYDFDFKTNNANATPRACSNRRKKGFEYGKIGFLREGDDFREIFWTNLLQVKTWKKIKDNPPTFEPSSLDDLSPKHSEGLFYSDLRLLSDKGDLLICYDIDSGVYPEYGKEIIRHGILHVFDKRYKELVATYDLGKFETESDVMKYLQSEKLRDRLRTDVNKESNITHSGSINFKKDEKKVSSDVKVSSTSAQQSQNPIG